MFKILIFLSVLCTAALASNQNALCVNAQIGTLGGQDRMCDIDSPYCNYQNGPSKRCGECRVMQSLPVAGGSCECDARSQYCSQASDFSGGQCEDYTMLNKQCVSNNDCKNTASRITYSGNYVTLTNERLFCVSGMCKPCDPAAWTPWQACDGYDYTLSLNNGRYATKTRLPPWVYTCMPNGDLVVDNTTVDYNYGYPCTNQNLYFQCVTPTPSGTPAPVKQNSSTALAPVFVVILVAALLSLN
jgi:hypothetical protein